MSYPEIKQFLIENIGLDPNSIGSKSLERIIAARMKHSKIAVEHQYLKLLKVSQGERQVLFESAMVPETWFFRDRAPFVYLRNYAIEEWQPNHKGRILRILSAPCSTGEEPFSIAITLVEAGFSEKNFHLDAVDISNGVLESARRGLFGKGSFREKEMELGHDYFKQTDQGIKISEQILELVHFQQANMLDANFVQGRLPYDVIFCRNLLIYMTPAAKERILQSLDSLLLDDGLFFTGHSETMLLKSYGYAAVKSPRTFAFRKAAKDKIPLSSDRPTVETMPRLLDVPVFHAAAAQRLKATNRFTRRRLTLEEDISENQDPQAMLEAVRELGNKGALTKAQVLCEELLQKNPLNSEAHYLMGLLHLGLNIDDQAEDCFLKALYLDPTHYPLLVQLYLLYERKGESLKAAAFRERANRAQTGSLVNDLSG